MKYVNYLIGLFVLAFIGVWIFNHVNSWAGVGVFVGVGYVLLTKFFKIVKDKS